MRQISQIILEHPNPEHGFLIYQRDSAILKPHIPFPSCFDLMGWHQEVETGETFVEALEREVKEEMHFIPWRDYTYEMYKVFECPEGRDVYANIKHIFHGKILQEGAHKLDFTQEWQKLFHVPLHELLAYEYANIIGDILKQYLVDTGRFT